MKNKSLRLLAVLLLVLLVGTILPAARASGEEALYTNPQTGFRVYILDEDDLLTDEEERKLAEDMKPVTQYGHAIFWSTSEYAFDEIEQARLKRRDVTGMDSAGIFVINMNIRKITFQSYGDINKTVTRSYARTVTDNVSHYATSENYYKCASEGFGQVYRLLEGERIAQPMKITSYAMISVTLGLLIAALIVFGKKQNTVYKKLLVPLSTAVATGVLVKTLPTSAWVKQNREYSPPSNDSSSSGCGGDGGCGGGGCGGGGSSSF